MNKIFEGAIEFDNFFSFSLIYLFFFLFVLAIIFWIRPRYVFEKPQRIVNVTIMITGLLGLFCYFLFFLIGSGGGEEELGFFIIGLCGILLMPALVCFLLILSKLIRLALSRIFCIEGHSRFIFLQVLFFSAVIIATGLLLTFKFSDILFPLLFLCFCLLLGLTSPRFFRQKSKFILIFLNIVASLVVFIISYLFVKFMFNLFF